jgi:hypothetical protein
VSAAGERATAQRAAADHAVVPPPRPEPQVHPAARQCPVQSGAAPGRVV